MGKMTISTQVIGKTKTRGGSGERRMMRRILQVERVLVNVKLIKLLSRKRKRKGIKVEVVWQSIRHTHRPLLHSVKELPTSQKIPALVIGGSESRRW